jgi:putative membrane protein
MLRRLFISIIGAGLLVPAVASAHMMGWNNNGWGVGVGMFFFWVIAIFLVIGLIRMIVWRGHSGQYSHWMGGGHHGMMGDRSLDILKERYAKGEITKEQFEQMKKDLQ